jgi:hypothetical protein
VSYHPTHLAARGPITRRTVALLATAVPLAVVLALFGLLLAPAHANPDTVVRPTSAYRVVNFNTGHGTVQVAVDIPALLRDGPDAGETDDGDEVAAYTGAYRIQGLSSGISRVQLDTAYLGHPGGIIEQSRVGPRNNGTRVQTGNTRSAGGNIWWGDAGSEPRYCTVQLRVKFSARLANGGLFKPANGVLSNPFSIPPGNDYPCVGP